MQFSTFSSYLQKLEGISSRLEITAVLAELFQKLESDEIAESCYLMQGQLLPPYQSREFQIAVKTVLKALARLQKTAAINTATLFGEQDYFEQEKLVEQKYKKLGDLGLLAEEILKNAVTQQHNFSIQQAYQHLFLIAQESGDQSQQRKLNGLLELLKKVDPISAKFIIRIILGRLRLGFSDMTIIDALSWAMTGNKSESELLEDAYQKKADIGKLAEFYLQQSDLTTRHTALQNYKVEVGVPVIPALCQRLNSAVEMIEKMHDVIAEPKYDGLRVQIHVIKKDGQINIKTFTRNLEETSHMFPELATAAQNLHCESCILDAEAIGYDPSTGHLLPFQQTIQRKRKHDITEKSKEVPVRFYVFDILSLEGEDLLQVPLFERKKKLHALFREDHILYHSPEIRTSDPVQLHTYHEENLAEGLEGVVVKQAASPYQSGRKGWSWVKIKEAEGTSGKLSDTIDVVVLGYYFGRGKRTEFGLGAILVGVIKDDSVFTIAKIGTGLTDETLREMQKRCQNLATTVMPKAYVVNKSLQPDVWCIPQLVVEVAADELTDSPLHSAGLALRFPRLVKFRDDKQWQQATTLEELKQIKVHQPVQATSL